MAWVVFGFICVDFKLGFCVTLRLSVLTLKTNIVSAILGRWFRNIINEEDLKVG